MAYVTEGGISLTDNDLQQIQQILFQIDYIPNPPFLDFRTDILNNYTNYRQIIDTINSKIKNNENLSGTILNIFNSVLGNTDGTQLGDDLDNSIINIFTSGNGNIAKLVLYILFELRPMDFSSLLDNTLNSEGLTEEDTIGYKLNNLNNNIVISNIPNTLGASKQVLRVSTDGLSLEWADASGGSDTYLPDREVLGEGQYMLITDSDEYNNPLKWRNIIDCGEWKTIS